MKDNTQIIKQFREKLTVEVEQIDGTKKRYFVKKDLTPQEFKDVETFLTTIIAQVREEAEKEHLKTLQKLVDDRTSWGMLDYDGFAEDVLLLIGTKEVDELNQTGGTK